jgi:hypothetical protein
MDIPSTRSESYTVDNHGNPLSTYVRARTLVVQGANK